MTIEMLFHYYYQAFYIDKHLNDTVIEGDVSIRNLFKAWARTQTKKPTFKEFFTELTGVLNELGKPRFEIHNKQTSDHVLCWSDGNLDIILCTAKPHRFAIMRILNIKFSHIKLQGVWNDQNLFQPATLNKT